jgi:ATP-dependent Clp protease ATP-binding subunit ClpX
MSPTLHCSFCGKSQHEVKKLIAGPTVFICDECVDLCSDIVYKETYKSADSIERIPEVCADLKNEFPWCENAIQTLAAIAPSFQNLLLPRIERAPRILLSGPTGCGSLELAKRTCQSFGRDTVRLDASTLRRSNWQGAREPFAELLALCDNNVNRAQQSVVLIDNVDFLCNPNRPELKAVQQELSSALRGDAIMVTPRGDLRNSTPVLLSTEAITFVLITHLPYEYEPGRGWVHSQLLVRADKNGSLRDQLISCGISEQIVSETTHIASLRLPNASELLDLLAQGKCELLHDCVRRLDRMSIDVTFSESSFSAIAKRAESMGFGTRSLQAILSQLTLRVAFEANFRENNEPMVIDDRFVSSTL